MQESETGWTAVQVLLNTTRWLSWRISSALMDDSKRQRSRRDRYDSSASLYPNRPMKWVWVGRACKRVGRGDHDNGQKDLLTGLKPRRKDPKSRRV